MKVKKVTKIVYDAHNRPIEFIGDDDKHYDYETALELIKKGHILIADDSVEVARIHNKIFGEAPEILRDMLEIRGLGIINVPQMFGINACKSRCELDFIIELERWDYSREYDRIGSDEWKCDSIFGVNIPKIIFPVREGRSMAELIETAVTDYILKDRGINCSLDFEKRVYNFVLEQKG